MKTLHLTISGKVQGVFFRAEAKENAEKCSISGWIKNTKDGKVEALITGKENDINEFISWCRRGPEKAKVHDVVTTEKPLQHFAKFEVLR